MAAVTRPQDAGGTGHALACALGRGAAARLGRGMRMEGT